MNKINWINGQAGGTPLSAENLNQMQDNIEDAIEEVDEKVEGTVLYNNATGTTGNITLNDSVANYDYIEIQGKRGSNYYSSGKLYNINGKNVVLTTTFTTSGLMYIYSKNIQINGNSITNISSDLAYFNGTNQNFDSDDRHFITRVVGYKIQD